MKTFIILLAAVLWLGTVDSFGQTSPTAEQKPQTAETGIINGHEYVDLGLSVKWATCNVGASLPEEYGKYYAWGEIRPKLTYSEENSVTWEKDFDDIAGNPDYDAARANWGSTWRLPTAEEIQELRDNCDWKWTKHNGVKGCLVTSKKNGNSIFLPAAGFRDGSSLIGAGEYGDYWSSSPYEINWQGAYCLYSLSGYFFRYWSWRNFGRSVRAVTK